MDEIKGTLLALTQWLSNKELDDEDVENALHYAHTMVDLLRAERDRRANDDNTGIIELENGWNRSR